MNKEKLDLLLENYAREWRDNCTLFEGQDPDLMTSDFAKATKDLIEFLEEPRVKPIPMEEVKKILSNAGYNENEIDYAYHGVDKLNDYGIPSWHTLKTNKIPIEHNGERLKGKEYLRYRKFIEPSYESPAYNYWVWVHFPGESPSVIIDVFPSEADIFEYFKLFGKYIDNMVRILRVENTYDDFELEKKIWEIQKNNPNSIYSQHTM